MNLRITAINSDEIDIGGLIMGNNNSKTPIEYADIPSKLFIPAIMIKEISRARCLSQNEKSKIKAGSPDIMVMPFIGKAGLMSRDSITQNYRYANGKKINIMGWKAENSYIISRQVNQLVMVMQVPSNHIMNLNGKSVNKNNREHPDYIVCLTDKSGRIDRNSAFTISSDLFKKMIHIQSNEVIENNVGKPKKQFDLNKKRAEVAGKYKNKQIMNGDTFATTLSGKNVTNIKEEKPINIKQTAKKPINVKPAVNNVNDLTNEQANIVVIAQILDDLGKRAGFVIQNTLNGETKKINTATAMSLCKSHKIKNMTVVANPNGTFFLRGVGISIDNLPIEYV